MAWQWSFRIPGVGIEIRYWTAGVTALLSGLLIGWASADGWGVNQWGPIASWFSGLATFFAVGVALYQTKLARDDANQAKLDAADRLQDEKKRHEDELSAANERLENELDAQRRFEQIKTITPIWDTFQQMAIPTNQLIEAVHDLNAKVRKRESRSEDMTHDDFKDLEKQFNVFIQVLLKSEIAFSPALMIVDQPDVSILIAAMYRDVRDFQEMAGEVLSLAVTKKRPSPQILIDQNRKISKHRDPMVKAVREHLAKATPLNLKGELGARAPQTEAPETA